MKYFIIFIFLIEFSWADDLSYKERSNEGENKHERIGKLENYLTGLSNSLSKIHKGMKKEFKKDLKALEEKMRKERESELVAQVKKLQSKLAVVAKGSDFAKKKYSEETRGQLKTLKNRIIDLLEKVEVMENRIKDIDTRP
jgi:archaellum component FlaC